MLPKDLPRHSFYPSTLLPFYPSSHAAERLAQAFLLVHVFLALALALALDWPLTLLTTNDPSPTIALSPLHTLYSDTRHPKPAPSRDKTP